MTGPADLLERLDAIMAELAALRAELAVMTQIRGGTANMPSTSTIVEVTNGLDADDLGEASLLDTTSAQERFGHPRNTLAKWCREEGLGVMRGGRWLVSIPRLQRRLNGS